jgi:hypothetical protein
MNSLEMVAAGARKLRTKKQLQLVMRPNRVAMVYRSLLLLPKWFSVWTGEMRCVALVRAHMVE